MSETVRIRFVDLFCGIGGFHLGVTSAAKNNGMKVQCVFASDIDKWAQEAYTKNFDITPHGDITQIDECDIPDHELLCAGFPCQPFSVFGKMQGFADTRGTLFFDIARILKAKRPPLFILENVKQLVSHQGGETLRVILTVLKDLGYVTEDRVLDARSFGLPQKRERVIIVGRLRELNSNNFQWPDANVSMTPLSEILEVNVPESYYASDKIKSARIKRVGKKLSDSAEPMIFHENKSGNISVYPFACALRAGSSYNYLLVNGERRLTEREMLRLQGFPDSYKVTSSYTQTRRQTGNAVPAPMIESVATNLIADYLCHATISSDKKEAVGA